MTQPMHPAATLVSGLAATRGVLEARIRELDAEVAHLRDARLQELEAKERLADRLARLVQALPAGVVVLDGRGVVREANPVAIDLLGEPLLATPWRGVIARAFHPEPAGADLKLNDGRLVTLQTCPLGQEPGQILLLQEVTEARRLQSRVEQTRRLADMGRMAANLAHQIRTPLASALLYTSQLNRPQLPDEKRQEFVAKALGRLRDLERLITDMLAFSRGEVGDGDYFAPQLCLESACEPFRESCAAREIRLRLEGQGADGLVRGNPTLLKSALHNLIHNAVQSIDGPGEVRVYAAVKDNAVDLVVEDNGRGVPAAAQAQLFEPFATTRRDGNGLGLAVVRAVARAHGGEAFYEPLPVGSRFTIRLPLAATRADARRAVGAE